LRYCNDSVDALPLIFHANRAQNAAFFVVAVNWRWPAVDTVLIYMHSKFKFTFCRVCIGWLGTCGKVGAPSTRGPAKKWGPEDVKIRTGHGASTAFVRHFPFLWNVAFQAVFSGHHHLILTASWLLA